MNIEGREEEYADLCAVAGDQENLKILPAAIYHEYAWEVKRLFMHNNALYTLPTTELIEFLENQIDGRKAIEIGCGSGHIAKALELAAGESAEKKFQYIVALNSDQVPYDDFSDNFKEEFEM